MIIYDILFILQFHVSTTVMDLVAVFALFIFVLPSFGEQRFIFPYSGVD